MDQKTKAVSTDPVTTPTLFCSATPPFAVKDAAITEGCYFAPNHLGDHETWVGPERVTWPAQPVPAPLDARAALREQVEKLADAWDAYAHAPAHGINVMSSLQECAQQLRALLTPSGASEPRTDGCVNCGSMEGGYETEDVGPFCEDCWTRLREQAPPIASGEPRTAEREATRMCASCGDPLICFACEEAEDRHPVWVRERRSQLQDAWWLGRQSGIDRGGHDYRRHVPAEALQTRCDSDIAKLIEPAQPALKGEPSTLDRWNARRARRGDTQQPPSPDAPTGDR